MDRDHEAGLLIFNEAEQLAGLAAAQPESSAPEALSRVQTYRENLSQKANEAQMRPDFVSRHEGHEYALQCIRLGATANQLAEVVAEQEAAGFNPQSLLN